MSRLVLLRGLFLEVPFERRQGTLLGLCCKRILVKRTVSGSFTVGLSNNVEVVCFDHLKNYVFIISSCGDDSWLEKP